MINRFNLTRTNYNRKRTTCFTQQHYNAIVRHWLCLSNDNNCYCNCRRLSSNELFLSRQTQIMRLLHIVYRFTSDKGVTVSSGTQLHSDFCRLRVDGVAQLSSASDVLLDTVVAAIRSSTNVLFNCTDTRLTVLFDSNASVPNDDCRNIPVERSDKLFSHDGGVSIVATNSSSSMVNSPRLWVRRNAGESAVFTPDNVDLGEERRWRSSLETNFVSATAVESCVRVALEDCLFSRIYWWAVPKRTMLLRTLNDSKLQEKNRN